MKVSQAGKRRAHTPRALACIRFNVMLDQCVLDGVARAFNRAADALRVMTVAMNESASAMRRDLARLQADSAIEKNKGSA